MTILRYRKGGLGDCGSVPVRTARLLSQNTLAEVWMRMAGSRNVCWTPLVYLGSLFVVALGASLSLRNKHVVGFRERLAIQDRYRAASRSMSMLSPIRAADALTVSWAR